jgi:hypothetical protein
MPQFALKGQIPLAIKRRVLTRWLGKVKAEHSDGEPQKLVILLLKMVTK